MPMIGDIWRYQELQTYGSQGPDDVLFVVIAHYDREVSRKTGKRVSRIEYRCAILGGVVDGQPVSMGARLTLSWPWSATLVSRV